MPLPYSVKDAPQFSAGLHREYRASIYRCHNYRLQPGVLNASFDQWIASQGHVNYAFVTAYNPYSSRSHTLADNLALSQVLRNWVRERGYGHHPAVAVDPQGTWSPEVGILIMDAPLSELLQLGVNLGQNAILYGEANAAPEVLWCTCKLQE